MGRPKGSVNKPKQSKNNKAPLITDKPKQFKASKNDGVFIHGPCGQLWPAEEPNCPTCVTSRIETTEG
jgi:hypothetical protein